MNFDGNEYMECEFTTKFVSNVNGRLTKGDSAVVLNKLESRGKYRYFRDIFTA